MNFAELLTLIIFLISFLIVGALFYLIFRILWKIGNRL